MNECLRCGRELKNPDDLFGWRCAEKIGIPINFKVEIEEDLLKLLTTLYLEDAKDGSLSPHNTWLGDVFTGLAPFSGNMDLLQTKYTNIVMKPKTLKDGTVRHYLFDTKTNTRLFEFDSHGFNTKSGRTKPLPHINVKSKPNANVFQTKLANALDHKKIPQSVYDAFKNFDDVGKIVKKGGKAVAVVGAVVDTVDFGTTVYDDYQDDGHLGKKTVSSAARIGGSWAGAWAGAKGGAALGTLVGSVFPGAGNVIGGFIGGVVGGIAGGLLGSWASDEIVDATMKD